MNWLSHGESNHGNNVKQNAVFRSNSFRFERPPPEDDARMYSSGGHGKGPVKSYSITAQDVRIGSNDFLLTSFFSDDHCHPDPSYRLPV